MRHLFPILCLTLLMAASAPVRAQDVPALASLHDEALPLLNAERTAAGLSPVTLHPALQTAAARHAADMAAQGYFDHTSPDGRQFSDRIAAEGYAVCYGAENLALGYPDARAAVTGWMNSAGHRRNILLRQATHTGIASAEGGDGRLYWVALFANNC